MNTTKDHFQLEVIEKHIEDENAPVVNEYIDEDGNLQFEQYFTVYGYKAWNFGKEPYSEGPDAASLKAKVWYSEIGFDSAEKAYAEAGYKLNEELGEGNWIELGTDLEEDEGEDMGW